MRVQVGLAAVLAIAALAAVAARQDEEKVQGSSEGGDIAAVSAWGPLREGFRVFPDALIPNEGGASVEEEGEGGGEPEGGVDGDHWAGPAEDGGATVDGYPWAGPAEDAGAAVDGNQYISVQVTIQNYLPRGEVRVLLNHAPAPHVRFLTTQALEVFVPVELVRDEVAYLSSYMQIVVDDDTVSWIPLRNLVMEWQRKATIDLLAESDTLNQVENTTAQASIERAREEDEQYLEALDGVQEAMRPEVVDSLQDLAVNGHSAATVSLAMMHLSGYGARIKQDLAEGAKLLRRAVVQGHPDAQAAAAMMHATGIVPDEFPLDSSRELLYLNMAADSFYSPYALAALAYRRLHGIQMEKSCHAALHFYSMAADILFEDPDEIDIYDQIADFNQVYLEDGMRFVPADRSRESFNFIKKEADYGKVDYQVRAASILLKGADGVPRNVPAALKLFERAAARNDAAAFSGLGYIYYAGDDDGIEPDGDRAFEYFRKAAAKGDAFGMYAVGDCYLRGIGVEVDYRQAVTYFKKARAKGSVHATFSLGMLHLQGRGVTRDVAEAAKLFEDAARASHLHAHYQVAKLWKASGEDCAMVTQVYKTIVEHRQLEDILGDAVAAYATGDYRVALYRFLQSAYMGSWSGQYNAAFMIHRKLGTTGELVGNEDEEALRYYQQAAQQNIKLATLKIGDIHYERGDYEEAARAYLEASKKVLEAKFAVGIMYMTGKGFNADYHMAKRYFDQVKEDRRNDGYMPAMIALQALYVCMSQTEACDVAVHLWDYAASALRGQEPTPSTVEGLSRSWDALQRRWSVLSRLQELQRHSDVLALLGAVVVIVAATVLIRLQRRRLGAELGAEAAPE